MNTTRPGPGDHPLRLERIARGLTVAALARRAGVSSRAIQYIERRNAPPRFGTRRRLLKALGVGWDRQAQIFDGAAEGGMRKWGALSEVERFAERLIAEIQGDRDGDEQLTVRQAALAVRYALATMGDDPREGE